MPNLLRKKNVLDETNAMSYIADGRNPQKDYYRLENRERQLAAVDNLSAEETRYVLGNVDEADVGADSVATIKKAIQKIHETDLIELRALVYLQRLPDTSPQLIQLKSITNLNTREEIAHAIAVKQIQKLAESQIDAIVSPDALKTMYKGTISKSGTTFASIFG